MIIIYQQSNVSSAMNFQSYSAYVPSLGTIGSSVTLEDILRCCEASAAISLAIVQKLNLRGFRREKPTRLELQAQNQEILNELRTLKRIIRNRDEISGGGNNGPEENTNPNQ